MQSSSQNVTTNKPTPSFYRPDALHVAQMFTLVSNVIFCYGVLESEG